jgi:hypothetical protein
MLALGVAALKPFWTKFTEGLADLAIRIIEYKLQQRLPGFGKDLKEIPAGNDGEATPKNATVPLAKRPHRRRRHRLPRHRK